MKILLQQSLGKVSAPHIFLKITTAVKTTLLQKIISVVNSTLSFSLKVINISVKTVSRWGIVSKSYFLSFRIIINAKIVHKNWIFTLSNSKYIQEKLMGYNLRVELQKCLKALFKKDSWTVKTHFSCKTSDLYLSGNLNVVYYFYPWSAIVDAGLRTEVILGRIHSHMSDQTKLLDVVNEAKDVPKTKYQNSEENSFEQKVLRFSSNFDLFLTRHFVNIW